MSVNRSFALFLLGIASASGQQPENPQPTPLAPPGVPVPGGGQVPAAGAPSAAAIAATNINQPGVPLAETKILVDINEPKLTGNQLAGLYRVYTGHRVIVSSAAAAAEFSFVQEASDKQPLTFGEAAELLRKAAIIENFVFVPAGENLDILTLATGGVRPPQIGIAVYNENDTLPEGDSVISYVMALNYIKPAEAVNTFTQIIGQFGAYGSIAAVPNASAIVITENTTLIRKLIDLKKEIDKPSSQVASRFIKVQYADVTEIATTLTTLLTAQQSAQTTAGIQRTGGAAPAPVPGGAAPAVAGAAGESGSAESTPVQIVPDPRTNRIFAMGRPVDLVFVEGLVREFDVETSEKNFLRRKLRFLTVSEFLPVASDALTRAFSGTGEAGGAAQGGAAGGAQGGRGNNQANNRQSGSGSTGNTSRNSGSSSGANFGGSSSGGSSSGSSSGGGSGSALSDPNISTAPTSVLVGRTLLVADNITNSIVVQGPPSGLEIIERLLDQIDVKPDQVMISTVIGQLTLNDNFNFGMDYLRLGNGNFATRGGSGAGPALPILSQIVNAIAGTPAVGTPGTPGYVPAVPAQAAGSDSFNPGSLGASSGLQVYGKIGNNLSVYLNALQQNSDFTVLSRPSIFTANNQKGTISSGERIAIPTSSNSYGSTGNSSTNIEYQDVVLKLEVIPQVNVDNEITMQIALLSDEQNGTQTISGAGGDGKDLTVPRISTREIITKVTVPNAETIVLGGLIIAKDTKDKSGIPILSSIPYIGPLFGSTTNNKDRTELMVFMQPSVVKNDRSLAAVQADMDSRYKVSPKAREMADGPGVLPPVDAITPVEDKSGSHNSTSSSHTSDTPASPTIKKKQQPIGPIHRR